MGVKRSKGSKAATVSTTAEQDGAADVNEGAPARKSLPVPLLAVLAVALAVRLWGISWGLPSALHYFSYHPDETAVLFYSTIQMNAFAGKLLPGFYNYGSLQLYLVEFANCLGYLFNAVNIVIHDFSKDYDSWARMTLIGRLLTVTMGVWTVGLTYGIGTRLWNARAGLLAAALLAVMPLHAQHSHWLTVDVPATFWITLSLYWSTRLLQAREAGVDSLGLWQRVKPAVHAGLTAGFATATKYNAALVILPILYAALPVKRDAPSIRQTLTWSILALVAFALAFLIGCPGSLLQSNAFIAGVAFEARHVSAQADLPFQQTGSGFVFHIANNLFYGMGWPLLLIALASVVYAAVRRERQDGLLAVFALPYYVLIGLAVVRYARYTIPLLPFLALWSGRMLDDLLASTKSTVRQAGVALTAVALLATAGFCLYFIAPMAGVDPRDRAVDWLNAHGYDTQPVGFACMPWFQSPPIDPAFGDLGHGGWIGFPTHPPNWQTRIDFHGKDWDMSILNVDKPPVIVLSQYDYKDAIRVHQTPALAFLSKLQTDYRVAAEFGGYGKAEIGPSGPAYDMMYPNPAIWIFVRKGP